jgi:hypothetical protein
VPAVSSDERGKKGVNEATLNATAKALEPDTSGAMTTMAMRGQGEGRERGGVA